MSDDQTKRILISLPQHLLDEIEEAAKHKLLSRTAYIRQVLAQAIQQEDKWWEAAYQKGRKRKLSRYLNEGLENDATDE